ncbi:hypothetical protein DPMN_043429 [Dreissena polymorpha]|uniref:Uncharacterized protein n=1 Tax=Dreissena polymorpha TaxID=45954 RepID=A0A9D4HXU5_DREPO|nr:hypothetical protein DPMN_043429 [Dreissena polymorpha]
MSGRHDTGVVSTISGRSRSVMNYITCPVNLGLVCSTESTSYTTAIPIHTCRVTGTQTAITRFTIVRYEGVTRDTAIAQFFIKYILCPC